MAGSQQQWKKSEPEVDNGHERYGGYTVLFKRSKGHFGKGVPATVLEQESNLQNVSKKIGSNVLHKVKFCK
jgi:hypothetical protein